MPAVSRQGDSLTTGHICVATTTLTTPGQSTVFANGIRVARKGDPVCCGSACATHSPNVFANGP